MNAPVPSHVSFLIAPYMRASAGRTPGGRIGPFTVRLDPHSDDPMRNYAVPDQGACPDAGDISALIAFFRRSQRIPRLEYIEDSAPRAWPALAAAGFVIERRTPVMIATVGTALTPRSRTACVPASRHCLRPQRLPGEDRPLPGHQPGLP